jgi:hypothetical protein
MGKGSERIAAGRGDSENDYPCSRSQAHHVRSRPQEDRSVSAGKVGKVEVGATEEGRLGDA